MTEPGDSGTAPAAEASRARLGRDGDRQAIVVDGVIQSVVVDGDRRDNLSYWAAMVPDARPSSVLVLGLGGGTVVHLLYERFGPLPVVGVERDPEVVALGRAHFGFDDLESRGLEVVVGDAFEYVAACERRFDLVVVDLYDGLQPAKGFLAKPFLRSLRSLLNPGGLAEFNLVLGRRLPKQLHRLMQIFHVPTTVDVDFNVVVFCRAP